jgi:hypothetical protein
MYSNAKLAKQSCKSIRSYSWSSMLASAGLAVQLANKELWQLILGNHPNTNKETRESAIARAKANQWECYQMLTDIKEQANNLCKTDLELCIEDAASMHQPHHPWSISQSNPMTQLRSRDVPNPMDSCGRKSIKHPQWRMESRECTQPWKHHMESPHPCTSNVRSPSIPWMRAFLTSLQHPLLHWTYCKHPWTTRME